MKSSFAILGSIALTAICWGVYGPVLHWGQEAMGMSRLRAFLCVGLAYFVIAVIVPIVMMRGLETDKSFSFPGVVWSSVAGAAGAIGALGIIIAMSNGGKPWFVMPLVFGLAPVVNAFFTISFNNMWDRIGAPFLAGLILVGMGAAMVLYFQPTASKAHGAPAPSEKSAQMKPAAEHEQDGMNGTGQGSESKPE